MDKQANSDHKPDFSLETVFNTFNWGNTEYPENGSSQGTYPREKNELKGITCKKCVKDEDSKSIIQELIAILNTAFKVQKEKLASEELNILSDTNGVLIGEKGIKEWILMAKVSKIESKVTKEFLKEQRNLCPYYFYKLTNIFENYLDELSKIRKKKIQDLTAVDFTSEYELIQKKVTSKFLENKFNRFLKFASPEHEVTIKHQLTRATKIDNDLINRYLEDLKVKNVSKGRFKKMQTDSKRFVAWLCNFKEFESYDIHTLPLWLIRKEHIQEYKKFLTNKANQGAYSLYGCKQHFKNIKTLFKRLYQLDLIPIDICENISNIQADDYFYRELPTDEEIIHLFKIIRTYSNEPLDDLLSFALMAFLGFRCCELVGLQWENINEEIQMLTLKSKGKNKYHNLPIPDIVLSLLRQYPENVRHGYVFKSTKLKKDSLQISIFKKFVLYKEMAGWNYQSGVHMFRHWYITTLSSRKIDLGDLRTLTRHEATATTSKYLHFKEKELVDDINRIFEGAQIIDITKGNVR